MLESFQCVPLFGANLGDSRTLDAHPASMMHSQLTEEQQRAAGADPEVIRMAIGLEDTHNIIADLSQAIDTATAKVASVRPSPPGRKSD